MLLISCSATPSSQGDPSTSSSSSPVDPKPTPDPSESQGPLGGPAYEPDNAQAAQGGQAARQDGLRTGEAPVVVRSDAVESPVPADPAEFDDEASYADGVTAATSDFRRGVVQGEGQGVVAGAEYVVFKVSVSNGSPQDLDLQSVVPALVYGDDRIPAAPLYGEVTVSDLTGTLTPGESAEGTYAFLIPASATNPVLYLDLNGTHQPLVFRGDLP